MKIIEIIVAWFNVLFKRKQVIAKERMKVCDSCPNKTTVNIGKDIDVCGMCMCPLLGKTHSPINSCDAKKWKR